MTARRTCEEVEPDLTAYRLGELDADAEAAITLHLETCEACRTASEEILSTLELLDEAFEEAPAAVEVAAPVPAASPAGRPALRLWTRLGFAEHPADWMGNLARAALILILPLTVVLGMLLPGLQLADGKARMTARLREIEAFTNAVALRAADAMEADGGAPEDMITYEVALDNEPTVIEIDPSASPGVATALGELHEPLTDAVDIVAEFWAGDLRSGEVAVLDPAPFAPTNGARVVAVRPSAPLILRLPPAGGSERAVAMTRPKSKSLHAGKPKLIESFAAHPGYNLTNAPARTGSESETRR